MKFFAERLLTALLGVSLLASAALSVSAAEPSPVVPAVATLLDGSPYTLDAENGIIRGVPNGTDAATFKKSLSSIAGMTLNTKDGKAAGDGILGTGMTVDYAGMKYSIAVSGDLDGTGDVTTTDLIAFRRCLLPDTQPDVLVLTAADTNGNGTINAADYCYCKRASAGTLAAPAPKQEKAEMTFQMTNASTYRMTCTASDGTPLSLTFNKKDWGTWNIGTLTVNGKALCGGGTDWEYVYRAAETASSPVEWSGGNHGNESLISLAFYDGDTAFDPSDGVERAVETLKIVETTKLHWGNPETPYADVVRTYTVVGQKIALDVNYDFIRDCWFNLSYTCMFPVDKRYGLYCRFLNDDGTENLVETLKVGLADYSGAMYKNNAASSCLVYGYEQTQYSFLVEVFTREDSLDNFANADKTFYWDMNTTYNKLYFSKFSSDTRTKVAAGTHWDTSCAWRLLIDDAQ